MATTATETATKPSRHELVQQMDPASSHQETKKVQRISSLQNNSSWKSELQKRGHQVVRNELQWSQRNGKKKKKKNTKQKKKNLRKNKQQKKGKKVVKKKNQRAQKKGKKKKKRLSKK